jgi:hypothetical protein
MSLGSCYSVRDVPLTKDDLSPDAIKEGSPEVFSAILSESEDGKIIRGEFSDVEVEVHNDAFTK